MIIIRYQSRQKAFRIFLFISQNKLAFLLCGHQLLFETLCKVEPALFVCDKSWFMMHCGLCVSPTNTFDCSYIILCNVLCGLQIQIFIGRLDYMKIMEWILSPVCNSFQNILVLNKDMIWKLHFQNLTLQFQAFCALSLIQQVKRQNVH